MMLVLIAVLLQVQIGLPSRGRLENPAAANPLPESVQKDFDKLWKRFVSGKEDEKVYRDLDKLLKKNGDAVPALLTQSYIDLYAGKQGDAESKLRVVLSRSPSNVSSLFYLAELAYSHDDFIRATELYGRLRTANPSISGIEMKSQRSLLLAMDSILQEARRAVSEDRLDEAERLYRKALGFAPNETALHDQLREILLRNGKTVDDTLDHPREPVSSGDPLLSRIAENTEKPRETADDLARWGNQIDRFREIRGSESVTREQVAALLVQYFPQLKQLGNAQEIVTDAGGSWAEADILTVVSAGILDSMANHTFQPARTVNRGEFARAVSRLTRVLGVSTDSAPSITPSDVVPDSALQRELQPVLDYELLALDNAGNFNVGANVSGEEAVNTAEKLLRLFHK